MGCISNYCILWTIRHTPQIWEENGGASYSPNVAYLAHGVGGGGGVDFFFSYFSPLKPRHVLWSSTSYSPKNTVLFLDLLQQSLIDSGFHSD